MFRAVGVISNNSEKRDNNDLFNPLKTISFVLVEDTSRVCYCIGANLG